MTDKFAEGERPMPALAFARREIDDWLKVKLSRGRCSDVMRSQLAAHYVNRTVDVHSVLREIGADGGNRSASYFDAKRARPRT